MLCIAQTVDVTRDASDDGDQTERRGLSVPGQGSGHGEDDAGLSVLDRGSGHAEDGGSGPG